MSSGVPCTGLEEVYHSGRQETAETVGLERMVLLKTRVVEAGLARPETERKCNDLNVSTNKDMLNLRKQTDSLRVIHVPAGEFWGEQAQCWLEHFSISKCLSEGKTCSQISSKCYVLIDRH